MGGASAGRGSAAAGGDVEGFADGFADGAEAASAAANGVDSGVADAVGEAVVAAGGAFAPEQPATTNEAIERYEQSARSVVDMGAMNTYAPDR